MRSWIVWLCQSAGEVSAEAKLFLGAVIRKYGDGPVRGVETSIGKRLGMSARVVSRVVAELVAAEHLKPMPESSTGKPGRPALVYKVRPELLHPGPVESMVAWDDRDEGGHFETLNTLLLEALSERIEGEAGPGRAPSREGAAERLSACNSLLLMTLLGIADRNGVVRGWGPSELSKLTGLTAGRLDGQIGKLLVLGYLRAVVPGVSGSSLFGKKPGAYFLNLSHPSYKGVVPEVVLLFPMEDLGFGDRSQGDARAVYRKVQRRSGLGPEVHGIIRNAGFADTGRAIERLTYYFNGIGTSTLPEYFQMRVEAYATQLLSSGKSQRDALMERQMKEVIALDAFNCSFNELKGGQQTYAQLVDYLACNLGDLMRRAIDRISQLASLKGAALALEGATYALIPSIANSEGLYVALCAMPASDEAGQPTCLIAGRGLDKGTLREERQLSKEKMLGYGLMTRPLKRVPKPDPYVLQGRHRELIIKPSAEDIS